MEGSRIRKKMRLKKEELKVKELELLLKMLESDMAHVKEEHDNYEEKSHPRYSYLKGQMNILNMYIHRVKSQMSLKG